MRHAKPPPAKYSTKKSTLWFTQADGKSFSREHIRDASNYYSRAGEVGTMPFGAFVHTRLPWTRHANPLEALHAIILLNRASAGFVIPTSHLDTEWKFGSRGCHSPEANASTHQCCLCVGTSTGKKSGLPTILEGIPLTR